MNVGVKDNGVCVTVGTGVDELPGVVGLGFGELDGEVVGVAFGAGLAVGVGKFVWFVLVSEVAEK